MGAVREVVDAVKLAADSAVARGLCALPLLVAPAFLVACSTGRNNPDSFGAPAGGSGGNSGNTVPGICKSNAFAKLEAPFSASSTQTHGPGQSAPIHAYVFADAAGLILSPQVDSTLLSDPTTVWSYPNSITTIDMQGTVKTLLTTDAGTGPVTLVADADSIYFEAATLGLGGGSLVRLPRSGGEATTLVKSGVRAGPVLVEGKIYYAGETASYVSGTLSHEQGVFEMVLPSGTPTLLSNRGNKVPFELTANRTSVYWIEGNAGDGGNYPLYKLDLADKSVQQIGPVSSDSRLMLAGDALYIAGAVDSYPLSRVGSDRALAGVVSGTTGAIALTENTAYYGSRGGLVQTPLDFSVTTAVSETSGMVVSAVAVGPQHIWYAESGCVYRLAK